MKSLLAAVAITAAMMTPAHALCVPADTLAPQAIANGLEMVDFDGDAFEQWLAEMISQVGPPPSGKMPVRCVVVKTPGSANHGKRVIVWLIDESGLVCDSLSLRNATADDVVERVVGVAI